MTDEDLGQEIIRGTGCLPSIGDIRHIGATGRRLVTAELAARPLADEDALVEAMSQAINMFGRDPRDPRAALDAIRPHIAALQARAETAEAKYDEALYIDHESVLASVGVGRWLSAALDDPNVCDEMKADIRRWFASGHPSFKWGEQAARDQAVARERFAALGDKS